MAGNLEPHPTKKQQTIKQIGDEKRPALSGVRVPARESQDPAGVDAREAAVLSMPVQAGRGRR